MTRRKELRQPLAEEVSKLLAAARPRPPIWQNTPAQARAAQARLLASRTPGPALDSVEDAWAGEVPLRIYRPTAVPRAMILYFHGGGWVIGSIDDSDAHARRMAASTGCGIVSVGYRLAPEHPFPAAIEDAITAWRWLLDTAESGMPLAIAGDSAGGNIAAGATIALRDLGLSMPAFQILGYPVLSATMDTPSYTERADGPILSAADMRWFWNHYAPDAKTRADPRASPLGAADLSGLPPALIMSAACDPLRDEAAAYAERLAECRGPVRIRCFDGMVHGFYKMADVLDGGRAALAEAAAFVSQLLDAMPDRQPADAKSAFD